MTEAKTRVQRNGRSTSWDAALLQTPAKTALLYDRIRGVLEESGPQTDEELLAILRRSYPDDRFTDSGVRSRRNELVLTGWVTEERTDDGAVVKRRGSTNSPRIVWRAVLEGEEAPTGSARPSKAEHDHAAGLAQARRRMQWETGEPEWAEVAIRAYLDPKADAAALAVEMGE